MAKRLTVLPADICVVDELSAVLLRLNDDQLARSAVILPTKRLGRYLLARLAQAKGALVPPKVTTIDGFIQTDGYPAVDDLHVELLIETLVDKYKYLRRGFAHEIKQIFSDLVSCGREDDFVELLSQQLTTDQHLADGDIAKMQQRFAELAQLLTDLRHQLDADRLTSHFFAHQRALQQVDVNNFFRIYVAAFTSVKQDDEKFFQDLARQDNVSFYLQEIPTSTPTNPTRDLLDKLNLGWQPPRSVPTRDPAIVELSSPLTEVFYVLDSAERLLADGVLAKDIAIVVTNDSLYLPHLLATIDHYKFAKNLALPIPLTLTTAGMFLQALANYCCQEYQVPSAIDLVYHPWSNCKQNDEAINEINDVCGQGIGKLPTLVKKESTKQLLARFNSLSKKFASGIFSERLTQLSELFIELQPPADVYETASIETVLQFLTKLATSSLGRQKISTGDFWQFVQEKFLKLTLQRCGEPLAGVQILSLPEVRGMPFQYIFVLGCHEGNLPKSLPNDVLLSDKLKKSIGLTSWQRLEAMEDLTFNSLLVRRARLTLSYCSETPSRFIEKLNCQQSLSRSEGRFFSTVTNGYRDSLTKAQIDQRWFTIKAVSASAIGRFIRCPMCFLLNKSEVASRDFYRQLSPQKQGEELHDIIAKFSSHQRYLEICQGPQSQEDKINDLTELLVDLSNYLTCDNRELALHLKHYSWPRLARFSLQKIIDASSFEQCEYEVDVDNERRWFPKPYRLRCRIDSLVTTPDYLLIIDYKSKRLPNSKEQLVYPQLPFYAYALQQQLIAEEKHQRLAEMVVAYFSVLDGKLSLIAHGANVDIELVKRRFAKKQYRGKKLEQLVADMHELIDFRQQSLLDNNFYPYADPSHCGSCQFADICRKDDPRFQLAISEQKFLANYLENRT